MRVRRPLINQKKALAEYLQSKLRAQEESILKAKRKGGIEKRK